MSIRLISPKQSPPPRRARHVGAPSRCPCLVTSTCPDRTMNIWRPGSPSVQTTSPGWWRRTSMSSRSLSAARSGTAPNTAMDRRNRFASGCNAASMADPSVETYTTDGGILPRGRHPPLTSSRELGETSPDEPDRRKRPMTVPGGEARLRLLYELGCAFAARLELDDLLPLVVAKCREALVAEGT